MAAVEDRSSPSPSPKPPSKRRLSSWSDLWVKKNGNPLKNVLFNMQQLQSLSPKDPKSQTLISSLSKIDRTLLLPDEILLKILSLLPHSQRNHNFLVCKRWLNLQGRLVRSLKVLDWNFLESGRLITRFPNLNHLDLLNGCLISPRNAGILLSHKLLSVRLGSGFVSTRGLCENKIFPVEVVDRGLRVVASGCPNLRKFAVLGTSELGLLSVAEECSTLQELELHKCSDKVLRGIAACENLQVLKLVGNVDGLYSSDVSDIGLTILAQGSKRLVKLELSGCGGSFDGIKAIGQCCQMLEELTLSNHGMEDGWLAGLSYCENLKTLRLVSCKKVDDNSGPKEYLGSCPTLERLHLQNCHLGEKKDLRALFKVCEFARDVVLHDCWGLDADKFILAKAFRRVHFLSLEGCSLLTTESLESVILSWSKLQNLRVVSCKNIKDSEVSPALSTLFSSLKGLKWRPDSKSLLGSCLAGSGMGQKGGKLLKRTLRPEFSASNSYAYFG